MSAAMIPHRVPLAVSLPRTDAGRFLATEVGEPGRCQPDVISSEPILIVTIGSPIQAIILQ